MIFTKNYKAVVIVALLLKSLPALGMYPEMRQVRSASQAVVTAGSDLSQSLGYAQRLAIIKRDTAHLGPDVQKMIFDATVDYLGKLQLLANALTVQEEFTDRAKKLLATREALEEANKRSLNVEFPAKVEESSSPNSASVKGKQKPSRKRVFIENSDETSIDHDDLSDNAQAVASNIEELLKSPAAIRDLDPQVREDLINSLLNYKDPQVNYFGEVLQANYAVDQAAEAFRDAAIAEKAIAKVHSILVQRGLKDIKNNAEKKTVEASLQADLFIKDKLPFTMPDKTISFQQRLDIYNQRRQELSELYNQVVGEINRFILADPVHEQFGTRLENKDELLPLVITREKQLQLQAPSQEMQVTSASPSTPKSVRAPVLSETPPTAGPLFVSPKR